jgi:hypothetical protein
MAKKHVYQEINDYSDENSREQNSELFREYEALEVKMTHKKPDSQSHHNCRKRRLQG